MVFVRYGVTAPDFNIDDYAGLDVRGAVVAMFEFEAPATLPPTIRAHFKDHDVKLANAARHRRPKTVSWSWRGSGTHQWLRARPA